MAVKLSNVYTFDFETNNSINAIERGETHVWLWDICAVSSFKHKYGLSIDSFMRTLTDMSKKDNIVAYSHNLKFDGSFVLDYLLQNGYVWDEETKSAKTYTCIIDTRLVFYALSFNTGYNVVTLRDSLKKIPSSVEDIAKAWKLPILKGEIDYRLDRPKGYIPSDEELAYINNDTEIVARVLKDLYKEGMTCLTASADALKSFKKSIGGDDMFNLIYPVVALKVDDFIRQAYTGGVCMVAPQFKGIELHGVYCYDVNSMYPSVMLQEKLPYGIPVYFKGRYEEDSNHPLFIQHIKVCMKVKDGKYPSVMRRVMFRVNNEYITDTGCDMIELYLCKPDYELMLRQYDIYDIEYIDGYKFKGSNEIFKKYITTNYELKCNNTGAIKQLAKLRLNSLYGKFASNPKRSTIQPYLDENGIVMFKVLEHYEVDPIYTAVSVFTTGYAHVKLFNAIESNHDIFVYCDTDSIHTIGKAKNIPIDEQLIGAWKEEKYYTDFKALAQKTYMGIGEKTYIKVAGASKKVKEQIVYNEFEFGRTYAGKLAPKRVKGGTVLMDTTFTFKER